MKVVKSSEGGEIKFFHLFGKKSFHKIDIGDCLFLLEIANWDVNYWTFRKNYKAYKESLDGDIVIKDTKGFGLKYLVSILKDESEISKDLAFKYMSNEEPNEISFKYESGCIRI
jgi:hypothetical protein